ncbi:MAG: hypothetical protein ACHQQ3_00355 [Gemmatimonadales bacterium]
MTRPGTAILICALSSLAACTRMSTAARPAADALVITADSSYWVTSDGKGLRMRGEPILIARLEGRFQELYVADDDRSYYDAVLVGQRIFVRDIIRGDSSEVLADTVVPRLAREYAAAHPNAAPLGADEQGSAKPGTTATVDLEILDVHPPYLSYEYHSDIDVTAPRGVDRHASRRGVLDLRTGKAATVAALFGREAADGAVAAAAGEWNAVRDSILARHDTSGQRAQRMLGSLAFDETSFSLDARDGEPQVVFAVPALSHEGSTPPLALSARAVPPPPWWRAQRDGLPTGPDSARSWVHGRVELVARATEDDSRARLVLRDINRREWPLGSVTAPVQRVLWLDVGVTAEERRALHRAFNESSQGSEDTRIAVGTRKPSPFSFVRRTPSRRRPRGRSSS